MRALALSLALLLSSYTLSSAQAPASSWVTELGAGAAADVFARGPWIAKDWRESALARVTLATGLSLAYEYVIEPWNGQTNAGRWQDAGQRLVGTLACEVLVWSVKRILR